VEETLDMTRHPRCWRNALAFEQLGIAGSFSPSAAMGNHLVKRFEDAGLKIETSETNKLIQKVRKLEKANPLE
jgi:hypothetical protein